MQEKKESSVDLLRGKVTFTDEPNLYRLILILMMMAFILGTLYLLRQWVIPALALKGISGISLSNILKSLKDKGP